MKYLLAFCFVIPAVGCFAQKFKPTLHLVKGQTYYLSSSATSAITQGIYGRENKVNLSLSSKMAFKVIDLKDTLYAMEVNYQSLDMKIGMADTTIDMNSNNHNKADTASVLIAQMMNKPFNITLSTTGKVVSIKNMDKIIAGVFDAFPKIDSTKKKLVKNQFEQSFGEKAFKGCLETGIAIFPQMAVAKNDTWTVNTLMESPVKSNVQTVYRLVDLSRDYYQLHGDGDLTGDTTSKPVEINGMPAKYSLNGTILTEIKIDKKTGWILEVKLRQLLDGNIEIMDNPKMPGGMTIPMIFNTEVTTTGR
jgi:hypothetical protein